MDISSYLAELIQKHKEVGVPNLGTFFKKKLPGRYDASSHAFLPPSYQLAYKPEVTERELLSAYIAGKEQLSMESANFHVEKFGQRILEALTRQEEVDLHPLGKFSYSNEQVLFQPEKDLPLGFEFFGLPTVAEATPLIEETPAIEETPTVEDTPALQAVIEENQLEEENPGNLPEEPIYQSPETLQEGARQEEQKVPAQQVPPAKPFYVEPVNYTIHEQQETKRGVPPYITAIIIVLAITAGILALVIFYPKLTDGFKDGWNAADAKKNTLVKDSTMNNTNPTSAADSIAVDSVLTQTDGLSKDTTAKVPVATTQPKPAEPATANTAAAPAVKPTGPVTYEVIGSSVYGEEEAERFIKAMKKKWGINAKIVSQLPGKKKKISVASYKDEKTARAERARLEEKLQIPGLYIYVNTNKPE